MIGSQWVKISDKDNQVDAGKPEIMVICSYSPMAQLVTVKPYDDHTAQGEQMTMHRLLKDYDLWGSNDVLIAGKGTLWESIFVNNMKVEVVGHQFNGQALFFKLAGASEGGAVEVQKSRLTVKKFLGHFIPVPIPVERSRKKRA